MAVQTCPQCGTEFKAYPSQRRVYCSRQCLAAAGVAVKKKTGKYKPCESCGKDYWVTPSMEKRVTRYCSVACRDQRPTQVGYDAECLNCQATFHTFPSEQQKYCSWDCATEHRRALVTKRACPQCAKDFYPKGKQKYCSWDCYIAAAPDGDFVKCERCGEQVYRKPSQLKEGGPFYCSRKCLGESQRLTGPGSRFTRRDGYVYLYFPAHRSAGNNGQVLEHRWVMEQKIGRPLESWEHVHHLNGVRDDNRPENLELILSGEHARLTREETTARQRTETAELAEYRKRFGPLT
jgi:hypothetical protein